MAAQRSAARWSAVGWMGTPTPIVAATVVGGVFTAVVVATPFVRFAYRQPALHLVLETAGALIGGLAAFLLYGRFQQRRLPADFLCIYALGVFAATNLVLSALPAALVPGARETFAAWSAMTSRVVGSLALATAAWIRTPPVGRSEYPGRLLILAVTATVAVIAFAIVLLDPVLPPAIDSSLRPGASGLPQVRGHPVLLGSQLLAMSAFAVAAAGFSRRARDACDGLLRWLAAGSVLAAFSRLHFFFFPSVYSQYVYSGDLLRLGFYLLLLVGAEREIRSYWRGAADRAAIDERRRIARDLHDGLAQELAFVATQLHRLEKEANRESLRPLAAAAERALSESRRAIHMFTAGGEQPLPRAIAQTAEEIAGRMGASLRLSLDEGVVVPPTTREELVRVVREAVSNATRHGRASGVIVELEGGQQLTLRVRDDGCGFDPQVASTNGFGLTSMRERAEALGGRFEVRSRTGGGTEVEVIVPWNGPSGS